ncbi:biotin/lipoyl-binding protein [Glaciihabitans arcticus]|uniref:Biotin/lipoyl-binding protein n=1 Tax=Glaciihabitans arcticus TaxID=2668039 RepID=A0A4V2JER5_9MICO|nr:biotin/lipoyl-binding protein [Glaciihabitans arcticus]TBN56459.1 biotin/lipoyl-binding protein [Glaciihabitans arcticus]
MVIARTWVFPILRILLLMVVAVALVKFAFFPDKPVEDNSQSPSAEIVEPQIPVALGTVQNDVSLAGNIAANPAVAVPATAAGEVHRVHVKAGQKVKKGQLMVVLRSETFSDDGTSVRRFVNVKAPVAGTVSNLTALVGQSFVVGDPIGQIAPPSFTVSGSIPPEQLYRLLTQPKTAEVTINGGPAPFTCTNLRITSPLAGEEPGEGESSGGPLVQCAVPADVRVFPGLTATIVIAGGIAENVLVVPMTAVEGTAETGNVYVVVEGGEPELRAVTLGLNDGINVEIKDGLEEGELILQFVPGALGGEEVLGPDGMPLQPGECVIDETGMEICSDGSR